MGAVIIRAILYSGHMFLISIMLPILMPMVSIDNRSGGIKPALQSWKKPVKCTIS